MGAGKLVLLIAGVAASAVVVNGATNHAREDERQAPLVIDPNKDVGYVGTFVAYDAAGRKAKVKNGSGVELELTVADAASVRAGSFKEGERVAFRFVPCSKILTKLNTLPK